MRTITVIALALLGVVLVATGGVVAHGNGDDNGGHDEPVNGTAAEWGTWMEQHMTEHMGADAAKRMQERMGMTFEEMGEHMASKENGSMMGGMGGMGCH